ncbi:hypothetical protein H4219_002233 [Mycoemilia scoparia]|uniref:Arrestin C-terminal-like domain-containing protein n=1 Tax=Mycoemilia scoparia TaxID=417184 RepID=A0A9W8A675_9FUNG|nr:hypothetical protein H4219_002233 [Mycoemilia scoparia]
MRFHCEFCYSICAEVTKVPEPDQNTPPPMVSPLGSIPFTSDFMEESLANCQREIVYVPMLIPSMHPESSTEIDEILFTEKRGHKVKPLVHLYADIQGCEAWPGSNITINYGTRSQTSNSVSKVTATLYEHIVCRESCLSSFQNPIAEFDRVISRVSQNVGSVTSPKIQSSGNNGFSISSTTPKESDNVHSASDGEFRTLVLPVPPISVGSVGSDYIRFSHYLRITLSVPSWLSGEQTVSIDTQIVMFTPPPQIENAETYTTDLGISIPSSPSDSSFDLSDEKKMKRRIARMSKRDIDHEMILEAVARMREQEGIRPISDGCLIHQVPSNLSDANPLEVDPQLSWEAYLAQNDPNFSLDDLPSMYYNLESVDRIPPTLIRIDRIDHPPVPVPKGKDASVPPTMPLVVGGIRRPSLVGTASEHQALSKRDDLEKSPVPTGSQWSAHPETAYPGRYKPQPTDTSMSTKHENSSRTRKHRKSDSVSSSQINTPIKSRPSYQAESRSSSRVNINQVVRSKSSQHQSSERPTSARSNSGQHRNSPRKLFRRHRKSVSKEDEGSQYVISKPLPELPIPVEIFTDPKVFEEEVVIAKEEGKIIETPKASDENSEREERQRRYHVHKPSTSHRRRSNTKNKTEKACKHEEDSSIKKIIYSSEKATPAVVPVTPDCADDKKKVCDNGSLSSLSTTNADLTVFPQKTSGIVKDTSVVPSDEPKADAKPGSQRNVDAIEDAESLAYDVAIDPLAAIMPRKSKSMNFYISNTQRSIHVYPTIVSTKTRILSPKELAADLQGRLYLNEKTADPVKKTSQPPFSKNDVGSGAKSHKPLLPHCISTEGLSRDLVAKEMDAVINKSIAPTGLRSNSKSLLKKMAGRRKVRESPIDLERGTVSEPNMSAKIDLKTFLLEGAEAAQAQSPSILQQCSSDDFLHDEDPPPYEPREIYSGQASVQGVETRLAKHSKTNALGPIMIDTGELSSAPDTVDGFAEATALSSAVKAEYHTHHHTHHHHHHYHEQHNGKEESERGTGQEEEHKRHRKPRGSTSSSSHKKKGVTSSSSSSRHRHHHHHKDDKQTEDNSGDVHRKSSRTSTSESPHGHSRRHRHHHHERSEGSAHSKDRERRRHHSSSKSPLASPGVSKELRKSMFKELPPIPPEPAGSGNDKDSAMPTVPLSHTNTLKSLAGSSSRASVHSNSSKFSFTSRPSISLSLSGAFRR